MDAVFFDMDGLLVDTEKVWFEVETEVVERLGGEWGPQHQEQLVGGSWERAVAYMLALSGSSMDPAVVGEWLIGGMVRRLSAGVDVKPGALELLGDLRADRVRVGLVTSSLRVIAQPVLDSVGRDHFEIVVTGDDVVRTKPDPEPYLTAASLMLVDPTRCAVLEDSPNGVASAAAAGCRVVAVPSLLPISPGPTTLVVPSLTDVSVGALRGMFH